MHMRVYIYIYMYNIARCVCMCTRPFIDAKLVAKGLRMTLSLSELHSLKYRDHPITHNHSPSTLDAETRSPKAFHSTFYCNILCCIILDCIRLSHIASIHICVYIYIYISIFLCHIILCDTPLDADLRKPRFAMGRAGSLTTPTAVAAGKKQNRPAEGSS